ncbi:hypothetical protein [Chakrabartyella piscis]|uniref:hypothetical protein n=1 Tax=Chakrabartyella piscis TaxID=2918914 RepID=UPI002958B646|nr:hypothetical protein [Chakrabartyella piscis]
MLDWINGKEMRYIEIFSLGMYIFRKNFKKIAFVVGVVFFPIAILHTFIMNQMFLTASSLSVLMQATSVDTVALWDMAKAYGGNQLLQIMVLLWLEPVGAIAIAKLAKSYLVEEEMSPKDAIGEGLNCLGTYMAAGVLVALGVGLGFGAFVIPGVYLGVLVMFYIQAIGLSGQTGKKSIQYSAVLVKGRWFKSLGFFIFIFMLGVGFNSMIELVVSLLGDGFVVDAIFMALSYFTESLMFICMTVLFLNREMLVHGKKLSKNIVDAVAFAEVE